MPSAQIPWRGPGARPARPAPPPRPDAAAPRRPDPQALALRRRLRRGADALRGPGRGRPARPVLLGALGPRRARRQRRPHDAAPGQPRGADGRPRLEIDARGLRASLRLGEVAPIESICPSGSGWGWTRKRAGVPIEGTVEVPGRRWEVAARGVDDESAGYHQRQTSWHWSAGVGRAADGRAARLEPGRGGQRPAERTASGRSGSTASRASRPRSRFDGLDGDRPRRRRPPRLRRRVRATPATRTSSSSAPATATASAPSPAPSAASSWPRASA